MKIYYLDPSVTNQWNCDVYVDILKIYMEL